jgi:uncharacterized membrane-anchored protein YitT (DUF2179 family)
MLSEQEDNNSAKVRRYVMHLNVIKKITLIFIGALICGISINTLVIPYGLLSGGLSGLGIIGEYLFSIPTALTIFLLNIPLFIWGYRELNKSFIIYSLIGNVFFSSSIQLTAHLLPTPDLDIFLASIFSGILGGVGSGIVLKYSMSLGGTDILCMIAKKKYNISVGTVSFTFNAVVIGVSLMLFPLKIALYTLISMAVGGYITNMVVDGLNKNKSVMIISDESELLAQKILEELHRGVTFIHGEGGFSGEGKQIINCVVNHYEIPKLKEIIYKIDPESFVYISEAIEVRGKGFT